MEIVSITPRKTPNRPMVIKFQWNNGTPAYVEISNGNMEFVKPVKNQEDLYWHFEKTGYKPNENIINSVMRMIVLYSRAFIDDKLKVLRESYAKTSARQKKFFEMNSYHSPVLEREIKGIYSHAMDLKNAIKDIELLEKNWRGRNEKKVS